MRRAVDRWARGFRNGVVAGTAATLILFAVRLTAGIAMPQEALFEQLVRLLPQSMFALLLTVLQHLAKPLGFATAVAASLFGFGVGGALYAAAAGEQPVSRVLLALPAAVVTWAALTFLLPAAGGVANLSTPDPAAGGVPRALALAAASIAYALLLARLAERPVHLRPALRRDPGLIPRRALVRRSVLALLVLAAASRVGARVEAERAGLTAETSGGVPLLPMMPPEITPTGGFYRVSKNFPSDPSVDVATWTLEVAGLVIRPLKLSFRELLAAPAVEQYQTLECISNEVGGDLIGNARWKGVRVRDILGLAGVRPEARTIIWRSADGYSESVSIDAAMDAEALLAFGMNGAPLPAQHGAPVRVLLPNRYGMKQPKWLTSIEVAGHSVDGDRARRGWSTRAIVKPASAFVAAARGASGGEAVWLGGWAYAGSRGVARVELSVDGGMTWRPALVKQSLGTNCWQFWQATWTPHAPGEYRLLVRAVDGAGELQLPRSAGPPMGPRATTRFAYAFPHKESRERPDSLSYPFTSGPGILKLS